MSYSCNVRKSCQSKSRASGFTLVELLVVLVIFLILVAIALPIVKGLISDQKTTRTAQNVEAFLSAARSRAIAEGRMVGVRFERLGSANYARSTCLRLRQLVGVPAYSGDAADAVAMLSGSPISVATFSSTDSPLIDLSARFLDDTAGTPGANDPSDNDQAPIQKGDLLELPGGRSVQISSIKFDASYSTTGSINVGFDLYEPYPPPPATPLVKSFPTTARSATGSEPTKYRIHRSPMPSTNNVMSLPQGMAIDLNYSGIGVAGSDFAPPSAGGVRAVDILFNANGSVTQVIYDSLNNRIYPTGLIYFCVGEIDGVANVNGATAADRDNLFSQDRALTTNIMNPDSLWVVVNPASGRVTTVAMATTGTIPADPTDPTTAAYGLALGPSRIFATLSDTVAE